MAVVTGVWFALAAPAAGQSGGGPSPRASLRVEPLLGQADLALWRVQPAQAEGLVDSRLRVEQAGRTTEIPLDGSITARRARAIGAVRLLPSTGRVLLHLDPHHDASGLLVVDLVAGAVVDAVTARDLVPSPDGRYWAFEEHAVRSQEQWPHTETVYAVYDAAASPEANARPCPTADDRCRGEVLFLPDRLALCRQVAVARGGSCLTADRPPRHARRSPFVWLSSRELAWVDVDLVAQEATLVLATMHPGAPATIRAVRLERSRVIEDVDVPPVREAWTIETITRDDDASRVWLQFRNPLPQAPGRRLGVRIF
ncbi:MAG: hypothetical protein IT182_11430 [Acidobacteria bacterium]|nr:hypothetical protein [Acidobacteriota bacterium]